MKKFTLMPAALAESAGWVEAARPVLDEYVEMTPKKGLDGKAILEFTQSTLE